MAKRNGVVALEASDVSITTAAVTIKAMQVNGRQMTQSVFRQLPERPLIDEEKVELLGLPWGWVNHPIAGQEGKRQFVAQFGTTLCRCPLNFAKSVAFGQGYPVPSRFSKIRDDARYWARVCVLAKGVRGELSDREIFAQAFVIEGWRPFPRITVQFDDFGWTDGSGDFPAIKALQMACNPRRSDVRDRLLYCNSQTASDEDVVTAGRERLQQLLGKHRLMEHESPEDYRRMIYVEASEAIEYCSAWDRLMDRLEAVEQLFIAA